MGMIFHGLEMHVTSASIPGFMTWPSIWPKPACRLGRNEAVGIEHAGWARHRIDDVADLQCELFDTARHPGPDHGLRQFHLGLDERGFGTRLLRGQDIRDAGLDALLCGLGCVDTALSGLDRQLELFDLTAGDDVRTAAIEFLLGL